MHILIEMVTEVLETPGWDDLLSERDLELLRAAEAHHRTELLRGEPSLDAPPLKTPGVQRVAKPGRILTDDVCEQK